LHFNVAHNSKIIFLDAPGAPAKPECLSRSKDHIEIGWKKPKSDGGAPIKGYNIERREKDGKKWTKINKDLIKVIF
jgi:hypothetical protein